MSGGPLPDAATFLLKDEVCPRCLGYRKDGMPGPHSCSDPLPTKGRGGDRRIGVEPAISIERWSAAERLARLVLNPPWAAGSVAVQLVTEDMKAEAKRVLGE